MNSYLNFLIEMGWGSDTDSIWIVEIRKELMGEFPNITEIELEETIKNFLKNG